MGSVPVAVYDEGFWEHRESGGEDRRVGGPFYRESVLLVVTRSVAENAGRSGGGSRSAARAKRMGAQRAICCVYEPES